MLLQAMVWVTSMVIRRRMEMNGLRVGEQRGIGRTAGGMSGVMDLVFELQ